MRCKIKINFSFALKCKNAPNTGAKIRINMITRDTIMKPTRLASLLVLTLFAVAACKSPKKMAKTVSNIEFKNDPEVLTVKGDSVEVRVRGKFPPKTFQKNAVVKLQPIIKYGAEERPLRPMYLVGEKVKLENAQKINYKTGGSFTYTEKMPYTPDQRATLLALDYTVKFSSNYEELQQCVSDSKDSVVRGTITTALTVKPTDDTYFYTNDQNASAFRKLIFYYVVDEGRLRDSVMRGPAVAKLRQYAKDTSFRFKLIILNSYASPDGELARNKTLVYERANSAYTLVKNELKRLGIKNIVDSNLVRRPDLNFEDWDGLKREVERSNISGKEDIMGVINSNMTLEQKEKALRALPSWNDLKVRVLPRLRRTEVVLSGSFPNRSYKDALAVANSDMSQLTPKELLLVANNTDDEAMKARIYKYYAETYANDWAGRNNYAVSLMNSAKGELKADPFAQPKAVIEAEKMLEDLNAQFPGNDTIINNLAVAKRFLRKYDDAEKLYMEARKHGFNVNYNLGVLYIKTGEYEQTVENFAGDKRCDYNMALGYMLQGDYDVAMQKIECIENKKAEDYYLRAIIAARKGDKDMMNTSLTRAVSMDSKMHDTALNDLEFRSYKNSAEFRNAIRVK